MKVEGDGHYLRAVNDGTRTGCAIKNWSHIFSPTGYYLNFSSVFGLAADKVHPYKFFQVKIKSKS